jgi:hypothetical protein
MSSIARLAARDCETSVGEICAIQKSYSVILYVKRILEPSWKYVLGGSVAVVETDATKEAVIPVEWMPGKNIEELFWHPLFPSIKGLAPWRRVNASRRISESAIAICAAFPQNSSGALLPNGGRISCPGVLADRVNAQRSTAKPKPWDADE